MWILKTEKEEGGGRDRDNDHNGDLNKVLAAELTLYIRYVRKKFFFIISP